MPSVPYTPYPTEQPAGPAQPSVNVSTPIEAFGGNIAQSISHMGKVVEHAGDELFHRAIAIQQLNNDAEAKQADTDYMIAAGKLHADYNALQGLDRVKGFDKYARDLEDTRTAIRSTLSNPAAMKIYDGASRSTMGRSIFNGAGAAASAQKDYVIGTAKANIELDAKTVEDNPQDERLFQDKRARIIENARVLSAAQGFPAGSPQEEVLALSQTSKLRSQQIVGLSRTKPFEAGPMLDKYKTELTPDDYLRTDNTVRAQGRAVGSVQIAEQVYNPEQTLKQMEDAARARAQKLAPDDPLLERQAVVAVQGKYNQDKYARSREDAENWQTVNGALQKQPRNIQEMRLDPKVANAIDALPKDKQAAVPGMINRFNAQANKVTNEDNAQRLYGMSNNDVEGFLNTDLTKEQLSQQDIMKFMKLQQKLKENPNQDPRVDRAIKIIRGSMMAQMEALGLANRKGNKDEYDKFTGALSAALDSWQAAHNKPATGKDIIETIAPEIFKTTSVPGFFHSTTFPGWNRKDVPQFQEDVPQKWAEDLKAEALARNEREPTELEIRRIYNRIQYNDLFGKKKSSGE